MEYYIYKGEDELYHWGIKGMKWGVRRYQNKDGSLTSAGKKRVNRTNGSTNDPYGLEEHDLSINDRLKFAEQMKTYARTQVQKDFADSESLKTHREWLNDYNRAYEEKYFYEGNDAAEKRRLSDREYKLAYEHPEAKKYEMLREKFAYEHGSKRLRNYLDTYGIPMNPEAAKKAAKAHNIEEYTKHVAREEYIELKTCYDSAYNDLMYADNVEHSDRNQNELYHWGIKGMKWGVRRYQNKDGSLTPAGQKRRKKLEDKLEKLGGTKKATSDDAETQTPAKKRAGDMDDAELAKAITRARMEDEYNRLRPEPVAPPKKSSVLVNDILKPAMINSGKKFAENALNKLTDKLLGDKVDPNSLEALKKTYEKLDYKQKIDKITNPDKYLSEDDKTKRQEREFKAEDRTAKMEGYNDASDKAAKQRETDAASRKAAADEAARKANEPTSKAYYESTYSNRGGEKTTVNPGSANELSIGNKTVSSLSKSTVSNGKSYVDNFANSYTELLDKNGNVIWSSGGSDDD